MKKYLSMITAASLVAVSLNANTINLDKGWNLIGSCVNQPASQLLDGISVIDMQGDGTSLYNNFMGAYGEVEIGKGYWINVSDATSMDIGSVTNKHNINLDKGWNLIGACSNKPASQLLDGISVVDMQGDGTSLYNDFMGAYGEVEIGKGYWINVSDDTTLNIGSDAVAAIAKWITTKSNEFSIANTTATVTNGIFTDIKRQAAIDTNDSSLYNVSFKVDSLAMPKDSVIENIKLAVKISDKNSSKKLIVILDGVKLTKTDDQNGLKVEVVSGAKLYAEGINSNGTPVSATAKINQTANIVSVDSSNVSINVQSMINKFVNSSSTGALADSLKNYMTKDGQYSVQLVIDDTSKHIQSDELVEVASSEFLLNKEINNSANLSDTLQGFSGTVELVQPWIYPSTNNVTIANNTVAITDGKFNITANASENINDSSFYDLSFGIDSSNMQIGDSINDIKLAVKIEDDNSKRALLLIMDKVSLEMTQAGLQVSVAADAKIYANGIKSSGQNVYADLDNIDVNSMLVANTKNISINIQNMIEKFENSSSSSDLIASLKDYMTQDGKYTISAAIEDDSMRISGNNNLVDLDSNEFVKLNNTVLEKVGTTLNNLQGFSGTVELVQPWIYPSTNNVTIANNTVAITDGKFNITANAAENINDSSFYDLSFGIDSSNMQIGDSINDIKLAVKIEDDNSKRALLLIMDKVSLEMTQAGLQVSVAADAKIYANGIKSSGQNVYADLDNIDVNSMLVANTKNISINIQNMIEKFENSSSSSDLIASLKDYMTQDGKYTISAAIEDDSMRISGNNNLVDLDSNEFVKLNNTELLNVGTTLNNLQGFSGTVKLEKQ